MNEVELLQQLRAGLPAARPESRAAARAGLMARIEHSQGPVRPRATPSWRRHPSIKLAVAGAALAALLVALPIGILGGGGKVQSALGEALHQAAAVAAAQEPLSPGPGQYLFTRSENAYLQASGHAWSVLVPKERKVWSSFDDSRRGRVRQVTGEPRFVSPAQRAAWVEAGSPALPRAGEVEDSPISGSGFVDAAELPTDPAELRAMLEAREIPGVGGPPGEAETFTLIGDMLRETYLPADIRAAIYELTAELPGVELLGKVEDPAGRPGTGIAFTDRKDGVRHELIFDPATSALLGERDTIIRSGAYGLEAPGGPRSATPLTWNRRSSTRWDGGRRRGLGESTTASAAMTERLFTPIRRSCTAPTRSSPARGSGAKASSTHASGGLKRKARSTSVPTGSLLTWSPVLTRAHR
jgi:hypothetical protein